MPRILFIAYYFPPMGGSGVQRPVKLAKYLERFGHEIHILAPDPPSYHAADDTLLGELGPARDRIHRVRGATPLDRPWASALLSAYRDRWSDRIARISHWLYLPDNKTGWIEPALARARELHARHGFDLIFATASPYSNLMLAARLRAELGIPVVMDLRDDWLESHLIHYPTPWHRRRMASLEAETLRQADAITVINEGVERSLLSRLKDPAPITVLPNGFDEEDVAKARADASPPWPADPGRLTFLYNGLFYGRQQPDSFLRAVRMLLDGDPTLQGRLRLVFQGDLFPRHHRLIDQLGLRSITLHTGPLTHAQSVSGLVRSDVPWLIVPTHSHARQHTPGKLFEYLGSGRPILALAPPGVAADMVRGRQAGWVVDPGDPDAITKTLRAIVETWRTGSLAGPDPAAMSDLSRRAQAERLHGVFLKLTQAV